MVHLAPVAARVSAEDTAGLFLNMVFRHHGLPESIVSDRDPRFTSAFWNRLFELLGTRLLMSTAAHPETDGQTESVNRVLEDVLCSYATSFTSWSTFLPLAEFAINNAVHASTGLTPFFVNNARHPRVPALLALGAPSVDRCSTLGEGGMVESTSGPVLVSSEAVERVSTMDVAHGESMTEGANSVASRTRSKTASAAPETRVSPVVPSDSTDTVESPEANFAPREADSPISSAAVSDFLLHRQAGAGFVRDALKAAVDKQKANADKRGRKRMAVFQLGDRVLLSTTGIQSSAVTNLGTNKLAPRFIGPFIITQVRGDAYTLDIPTAMRRHPTFYVGRLKRYHSAEIPDRSKMHHLAEAIDEDQSSTCFFPRRKVFCVRSDL